MAIAIARRYLKGEGFIENREDEEGLKDGDKKEGARPNYILDLQAGHGSYVAGIVYARAILEAPGKVASIQ